MAQVIEKKPLPKKPLLKVASKGDNGMTPKQEVKAVAKVLKKVAKINNEASSLVRQVGKNLPPSKPGPAPKVKHPVMKEPPQKERKKRVNFKNFVRDLIVKQENTDEEIMAMFQKAFPGKSIPPVRRFRMNINAGKRAKAGYAKPKAPYMEFTRDGKGNLVPVEDTKKKPAAKQSNEQSDADDVPPSHPQVEKMRAAKAAKKLAKKASK